MDEKDKMIEKSGKKELDRLEKYFQKRGINYERNDRFNPPGEAMQEFYASEGIENPEYGEMIAIYDNEGRCIFDAIYGLGAYGDEENPLELGGCIVENDNDAVEGYLNSTDIVEKVERMDPYSIIEQGLDNLEMEEEKKEMNQRMYENDIDDR